jgi:hypothetical protein
MMAKILQRLGATDKFDSETDDEDYDDDDTIMQQSDQHTETHPGASRTNHSKGKNKNNINQRTRNSAIVAAGVK